MKTVGARGVPSGDFGGVLLLAVVYAEVSGLNREWSDTTELSESGESPDSPSLRQPPLGIRLFEEIPEKKNFLVLSVFVTDTGVSMGSRSPVVCWPVFVLVCWDNAVAGLYEKRLLS